MIDNVLILKAFVVGYLSLYVLFLIIAVLYYSYKGKMVTNFMRERKHLQSFADWEESHKTRFFRFK